jgi:hypothetical protein
MSRRRPIAAIVLATVAATIGLTALPASAAQVSVEEYVRSVCTGIGDFQTTITDSQAAVESQVEDLTDVPSAKDAFLTFMGDFVGAVDQLRTDLKAAGTPQIENGGKLAAVLRTGVGQMHTLVQGAEDRASDLPTGSPKAFTKALTKINRSMDKALDELGDSISEAGNKYDTGQFDDASDNEPACTVIGGGSASSGS